MAGIFPSAGISAPNTTGGDTGLETIPGCDALFYRNNCAPRFDPVAMNFIISEIGNAVNALGDDYNCSATDNLKKTLQKINNWCARGVIHPTGDLSDDFVMACLAGVQGKMPIQDILNRMATLCSLPDVLTPDLDDSLAGCFDGAQGKIVINSLLQLIIANLPAVSQGAPRYVTGQEILFPNNDTRDSLMFSLADCDGLYIKNPWKARFYNGDGVTPGIEFAPFAFNQGDAAVSSVYLDDTGPGGGYAIHQFGAMTFERIAPNSFMTFGSSRVASQGCYVPNETNVWVSRHEVGPGTENTRIWKIHKIS